jgi:hypothetical protein
LIFIHKCNYSFAIVALTLYVFLLAIHFNCG